jgi:hypothetical protein
MVTKTELNLLIDRWKRGMRPLKIDEQQYGHEVLEMLENYKGHVLGMFDDPLEAATLLILIGMMKEQEKRRWRPAPFDP